MRMNRVQWSSPRRTATVTAREGTYPRERMLHRAIARRFRSMPVRRSTSRSGQERPTAPPLTQCLPCPPRRPLATTST
jgi:hypothetical protein